MSMKHTPGPWFRDANSGLECDVRASSGRKIALCWGLAANNATNDKPKYRAECDANAHLIAAAPELLMALQLALPALEYLRKQFPRSEHDDSIDALAITKAAIAKTTGEQQ